MTWRLKVSLVLSSLLLASCNRGTQVLWLMSPDGNLEANVVKSGGWGATVGTEYRVLVNTRANPFSLSAQGPPAWEAYSVPVKYLFWRDDKTLEVVVSRENRAHFRTIRVASIEGVSVVTTVLHGTSKRDAFDARLLETQDSANPQNP